MNLAEHYSGRRLDQTGRRLQWSSASGMKDMAETRQVLSHVVRNDYENGSEWHTCK